MKFIMYSVKDELTEKFMSPMFIEDTVTAETEAVRQFKSNMNNIKLWRDNPNDFSLYKVGMFDDKEGASAIVNEKIISGRSLVNVQEEN